MTDLKQRSPRSPLVFSSVLKQPAVDYSTNLCTRILTNRLLPFQTEFPQSGRIFPGFPEEYPRLCVVSPNGCEIPYTSRRTLLGAVPPMLFTQPISRARCGVFADRIRIP